MRRGDGDVGGYGRSTCHSAHRGPNLATGSPSDARVARKEERKESVIEDEERRGKKGGRVGVLAAHKQHS